MWISRRMTTRLNRATKELTATRSLLCVNHLKLGHSLIAHGLPEHTLPNPFLRYKNPISNRWQSPVYGLRKQTELVREARRLGMMHILPSGPKTPTEYANTSLEVSKLYYAEDRETVIRKDVMGTIKWAGEYVPELNPFGAGKWAPGGIREGQEHSFNGIPYWGRYK